MPAAPHRLAALLGVFAAAPALAQHPGAEPVEEVIVSAPYARAQAEMLQATSVLSGEGLDRALAATLGETLAHLPGVSSSYFGPGASRPIIRGLGGERVRVLIDGIGAIDASNTSPDHAVAGEPVTAERIEVVRGPASLLYGSSAAGGVVNVIDGRIPAAMPEKGAAGTLFGRYASNDDEAATAASLTLGAGAHVAVHADGFYRDTGDIRVPGVRGPLANTDTETYGGAAGVSYVFERGFFGVSAANFQSDYGVPTAEGQEEAAAVDAAAGGVRIDLDQIRVDVKGRLGLDGFFKEAKLRFGYGDYEHRELEGGVTGTRFLNEGWEGRLELVQRGTRGHRGAVGMQVRRRDFEAIGAEAFVPPNATTQLGLFTVQEVDLGPAR
ncbi:MAG: TonB-dependent receptor, partial [Alphaproteobacteria bacterium]